MKKDNNIKYKIDSIIIKNYVETINSLTIPISKIKELLFQYSSFMIELNKSLNDILMASGDNMGNNSIVQSEKKSCSLDETLFNQINKINTMLDNLKYLLNTFSNEKTKIYIDIIRQIMDYNNGMLSTRMLEPLNISRQYLSIMEKNKLIEKVSRGIYISPSSYEDTYFSLQQKYKKVIFSHMNALYFFGISEEFPYNFTVTVPQTYHVDIINEKCNVFYVSNDIYELGITEVKTPNGNKVKAYDLERCICDIIRSSNRMDYEQVKKTLRKYMKSNDKDLVKLSEYSKKMGINEKVMKLVGDVYYD